MQTGLDEPRFRGRYETAFAIVALELSVAATVQSAAKRRRRIYSKQPGPLLKWGSCTEPRSGELSFVTGASATG